MSIKDKLFRLLFPQKHADLYFANRRIETLSDRLDKSLDELSENFSTIDLLRARINRLEKELNALEDKPTMADLMREDLGIMTVDFFNTKKSGDEPWNPPHYLYDEQDEPTKKAMISELSMIYSTTVFKRMIEYHINSQGNFTLRKADGEHQILAGRMTINGISLIYQDVLSGYEAYQESRKPEEEFDKFDLNSEV